MMHFHSVYVQKRQPGVSPAQFQRLWRSHGDFAATVPTFWDQVERYVHNDPVEATAGVPADTARFDAVGELYYTSYEHWLAMRDVMWNVVAPDEKRVFAGPPTVSVRGARKTYQTPEGACKLFTFARFRGRFDTEGTDAGDDARALDALAETTLATPGVGGALQGLTITTASAGMAGMAQTLSSHDVLVIAHFADEGSARAALATACHARREVAQDAVFDWTSRVTILTHGWVLKGTMG